jgi:hypothetical protein
MTLRLPQSSHQHAWAAICHVTAAKAEWHAAPLPKEVHGASFTSSPKSTSLVCHMWPSGSLAASQSRCPKSEKGQQEQAAHTDGKAHALRC